MKKFIYILAAFACTGCVSDDREDYTPDLRLMFEPQMYMHVSHADVDCFSLDENFVVGGWKLPAGTASWESGKPLAVEHLQPSEASSREVFITIPHTGEILADTLWMVSDATQWPATDECLAFMAYSPSDTDCSCTKEDGITYSVDALQNQTDLLYTDPRVDRRESDNGYVVQLNFKHALCRINFRVKHRVAADEQIAIKRITIDDVRHKGTFRSLHTPQWSLQEQASPLDFFEGNQVAEPLPEPIGRYWMVVPQALDTQVTVEYEYTTFANTSVTNRLQTVPLRTKLEPGLSYTYTLSVGIDDVKFLQEIIQD